MEKQTPENLPKQDEKYKHVLDILKIYNFKPTMADSFALKETINKILKEVKELEEKDEAIDFSIDTEIIIRFFWYYYKINLEEHLRNTKKEFQENIIRELFDYAQKSREESELI
jgi:hypothetical protein